MALDPRIEATVLGVTPTDRSQAMLLQKVRELERRIAVLERTATVQAGAGPPTATTRDGTPYVDITNSRLYVRSAGVWKYAALT